MKCKWARVFTISTILLVSNLVIIPAWANAAVSVTLSPGSVFVQTGATQQFAARVSGTRNAGVTWSATGGSVSNSGVYTAPDTVGTYTVTATSIADTSKSASTTVNVVSEPTITAIGGQNVGEQFNGESPSRLSFPMAVTAGNQIIVAMHCYDPDTAPSINLPAQTSGTARIGNFTQDAVLAYQGSYFFAIKVLRAPITTSGSLTMSFSGSNCYGGSVAMNEFNGIGGIDGSPTLNNGTGSTESSGDIVTSGLGMVLMTSAEESDSDFDYALSDNNIYNDGQGATDFTSETQFRMTGAAGTQPPLTADVQNDWLWWSLSVAYVPVSITVSPSNPTVNTDGTVQFSAAVSGLTNTDVTWSATGGTVSNTGLYTAPSTAGTYTVTATSVADSTKSGSATITVTAPTAPVSVNINPASASLQSGATQQFTATVTGTTNTGVTWSATGGTLSDTGLYTAPTAAGTYTVTATSVADPTKSASATVTVTASTSSVSVTISPASASLQSGATQQFTATVTGTTNTGVTWSATGGTVNNTGLYTAPSAAGTYTVTATSVADPTKTASAAVTVASPVTVSITPASASLQIGATQQFTATITGSTNTSVTWTTTGGSISNSGLYTAPSTAGTYNVTATSVADPTKSASADVTVSAPPPSVSVAINPATASLSAGSTQQFTATVTGTTNTGVSWTATGGTVNSAGLYTAPPAAGTYTVTATSVADTTKSASAAVTVTAQSGITSITGQNVGKQFNGTAPPVLRFANNVTAGDQVLVAFHCYNPSSAPTINLPVQSSGTAGLGAFTQDGTATFRGGNYYAVKIFRAPVVSSGSLALSFSVSNCYGGSAAMGEFQGITGIDGTQVANTGSGVTESSGSLQTSAPGMVLMTSAEESSSTFSYSLSDNKLYSNGLGATDFTSETQYRMTTAGGTQSPLTAGTQNNWMWWALSVAYTSAGGGSGPSVTVTVDPSNTNLVTGATQQFSATVTGTTNTGVTWTATGGTIDTSGLYTAPSTAGTYTVTATSVADPTKSASATVTVATAQTQLLSVSPTSVDFGSVVVGQTAGKSVTLSNTGNTTVQVTAANFTGMGFSTSGLTLPINIAAGASRIVTLNFSPQVSGPASGSVSFVSNASNSPATVALSGSGTASIQHYVDLSWTASTSTGVVGYYMYRGSSSGGPYTKLNSSPDSSLAYTDSTVTSGTTYYYVVTAVDGAGNESAYSNESVAVIPNP